MIVESGALGFGFPNQTLIPDYPDYEIQSAHFNPGSATTRMISPSCRDFFIHSDTGSADAEAIGRRPEREAGCDTVHLSSSKMTLYQLGPMSSKGLSSGARAASTDDFRPSKKPNLGKAQKYYGVKRGRRPGVYSTWEDAEAQVSLKVLHTVQIDDTRSKGIQALSTSPFPTSASQL